MHAYGEGRGELDLPISITIDTFMLGTVIIVFLYSPPRVNFLSHSVGKGRDQERLIFKGLAVDSYFSLYVSTLL